MRRPNIAALTASTSSNAFAADGPHAPPTWVRVETVISDIVTIDKRLLLLFPSSPL
eukprot:COSAG01_NODE_1304_length_10809_cov_2.635387_3_plen_56_part_00